MCPPEIRKVHGKHNSFVTAKQEYLYKQRKPDSKLKSHTMLHSPESTLFAMIKKRAPGTKIQYFRKVYLQPLFHTMDYPKFIIVSNQKVKIINYYTKV